MPKGIRYRSLLDNTGYGVAALGYVRALVNAGVPVQWCPMRYFGGELVPMTESDIARSASVRDAAGDAALEDLPALLRATSAPVAHDTVLCHLTPEHWPRYFERGRRNVGCTVWETDRTPPHWRPLFDIADRILVPCRMNRESFVASGTRTPVRVVPHVRRHAWNAFTPAERAAARAQFGIPEDHYVFYSINVWDPRKALPLLLEAFLRAFRAGDPVTLLVKTTERGSGPPPLYLLEPSADLARRVLERCAMALGGDRPNVFLLPIDGLTGCEIDLLHEVGDCYVSLAHGEGWALGAFDAATRGTPVLMTGWGGQLDYLGEGWPGAVPFRPCPVPIWPPSQPSYFSSMRWACPDVDAAARLMRATASDGSAARAHAAAIAEDIANRYAEPAIGAAMLAALDD